MYTAFYKASQYLDLATVTSIFFALFFSGVIVWVLLDRGHHFEHAARLPLEDDTGPKEPGPEAGRQNSTPR